MSATGTDETARPTAHVAEVFSSIQGEGVLVGTRQVFCRFYGCGLSCVYCDTPAARAETGPCMVERTPGERDFQEQANPFAPERLVELVAGFDDPPGLHHSVAITGGEPLLRARFLAELAPLLRGHGLRTYLETNGLLPDALERTVDAFDIVAMDIKLPSAIGRDVLAASEEFLRIVHVRRAEAAGPDVFVKVVLTAETTDAELERACRAVAAVDGRIPFVLQPVTPAGAASDRPGPDRILEAFDLARRALDDVRVIPQTHRFMQQL
ncbi:MAG: 7-carboxy-7-deazaguanine synthase QueE [Armatimonadota bacterium]